MEYKVRKGIENPCKIHGLLVRDFYLLLGYGGFAVAVLLLNVKSWLEDGTTGGEMLFIFVLLVGCGLLLQGSSIRMPQGRSTGRRIGRRRLQTVM